MKLELTEEIILLAQSDNGGWSEQQFDLIRVDWPPRKGWKSLVIGKEYDYSTLNEFLMLKNNHF